MNPTSHVSAHRTLRFHEWLALLAMMLLCTGVRATSVYRCTDSDGGVAYQSTACADAQHASVIDIAPAQPLAPSPTYAVDTKAPARVTPERHAMHASQRKVEMAYECRASDGDVFYRLGHCPRSLAAPSGNRRGSAGHSSKAVTVTGHPVPRAEACSEMRRAGAIGRKGHEYDEAISTYDRNIGNDPCK